ncbi:hypothetical protein [Teredinibacter sp. KSP-S5-2]|uniref:hypothetical protein n=1 Tax=Teredinibacter sp. KSP-S5-2 TaxID=3034506 RepID=UPI0029351F57|nr:hypothetical protein [Teredinibacter sp. KSP-S5-2]WNO07692.1 hypothetical protein P5V12_11900 [Teredinibacter sp. KSP-S5-2]
MSYLAGLLFAVSSCFVLAESTEEWAKREMLVDPYSTGEEVVSEWMGGEWRHKGLRGKYRFVITKSLHANSHKFYIQWLRALEQGDEEVAYSLGVREINMVPSFQLSDVNCVEGDTCRIVQLKATHSEELTSRELRLDLYELGRYNLSF